MKRKLFLYTARVSKLLLVPSAYTQPCTTARHHLIGLKKHVSCLSLSKCCDLISVNNFHNFCAVVGTSVKELQKLLNYISKMRKQQRLCLLLVFHLMLVMTDAMLLISDVKFSLDKRLCDGQYTAMSAVLFCSISQIINLNELQMLNYIQIQLNCYRLIFESALTKMGNKSPRGEQVPDQDQPTDANEQNNGDHAQTEPVSANLRNTNADQLKVFEQMIQYDFFCCPGVPSFMNQQKRSRQDTIKKIQKCIVQPIADAKDDDEVRKILRFWQLEQTFDNAVEKDEVNLQNLDTPQTMKLSDFDKDRHYDNIYDMSDDEEQTDKNTKRNKVFGAVNASEEAKSAVTSLNQKDKEAFALFLKHQSIEGAVQSCLEQADGLVLYEKLKNGEEIRFKNNSEANLKESIIACIKSMIPPKQRAQEANQAQQAENNQFQFLDRVYVVRSLPTILKLLSRLGVQAEQYIEVLTVIKEVVSAPKKEEESSYKEEEKGDGQENQGQAPNQDLDQRELDKLKDKEKLQQFIKQAQNDLNTIQRLGQAGMQYKEDYKIDVKRVEKVQEIYKKAEKKAEETLEHAEGLLAKNLKEDKKCTDDKNDVYEKLQVVQREVQAVKDIPVYFLQQIWLFNCPEIFNFFIDLNVNAQEQNLNAQKEKEAIELIWQMPEKPESEKQILQLENEVMQYLPQAPSDGQIKGDDLLNVEVTMLIKMSDTMMQMKKFPAKLKVSAVEIFIEYFKKQMEDYRQRKDRSNILTPAIVYDVNEDETQNEMNMCQIVLFFVKQYFSCEKAFQKNKEGDHGRLERLEKVKARLMEDIDVYFNMFFAIYKFENQKDKEEKKKQQQQEENKQNQAIQKPTQIDIIEKFFNCKQDKDQINAKVLKQSMLYYNKNTEKIDDLIANKRSLSALLDKFFDDLSQKDSVLKFFDGLSISTNDRDQTDRDQEEGDAQEDLQNKRDLIQILTDFCVKLYEKLVNVKDEKAELSVRENRPLFCGTWLLMLQLFIMRASKKVKRQLKKLKKVEEQDEQDEQAQEESDPEQEQKEQEEIKKMMDNIIDFWQKTQRLGEQTGRRQDKNIHLFRKQQEDNLKRLKLNKQILTPTDEQIEHLRKCQIPSMIKLIGKETQYLQRESEIQGEQECTDIPPTLQELLKFLILYSTIIFTDTENDQSEQAKVKNIIENRNKSSMIDILPILVEISETQLLPYSRQYQKYATKTQQYLWHCGQDMCADCEIPNKQKVSFLFDSMHAALDQLQEKAGDTYITSHFQSNFQSRFSTTNYSMYTQTRQTTAYGTTQATSMFSRKKGEENLQFYDFIISLLDNFAEIERRIFLKFNSCEITIQKLREKTGLEEIKVENDEQCEQLKQQEKQLFEAWKKEEKEWQKIAYQMDQVKEYETRNKWQSDQDKNSYYSVKDNIHDQIIERVMFKKKKAELEKMYKDENEDDFDISLSTRKPMNEFYDAYCAYMLLKAKIKHQAFDKAEDMIKETNDCIAKQDNMRSMMPSQSRQFMTPEKAFLLKETIDAIIKLVKMKQGNTAWLDRFLPRRQDSILKGIKRLVEQLGYAGFPIEAADFSLNTIEQIINHDNIFKSSDLTSIKEREIKQVKKMIEKLGDWHEKLVLHSEKDMQKGQDPGYCDYVYAQFFGKQFPVELTLSKEGYLFRVYSKSDIQTLSAQLRNLFTTDKYKYDKKPEYMKITGVKKILKGNSKPYHLEQNPSIFLIIEVKPLDKNIQDTYFSDEEEKRRLRNENEQKFGNKHVTRLNYVDQYNINFISDFFIQNRSINQNLKASYEARIDEMVSKIVEDNHYQSNLRQIEEEQLDVPMDKQDQDKVVEMYLVQKKKVLEIATEAFNRDHSDVTDEKQKKATIDKIKSMIEKVIEHHLIQNFVLEDEKLQLKQPNEFMTSDQFKEFVPKYQEMIGNYDNRSHNKLWRDIKNIKIQKVVNTRAQQQGWTVTPHITFEYKSLIDQRAKESTDPTKQNKHSAKWDSIEIEYIKDYIKKFVGNIKYYHTSTLHIWKVDLQFPTGFLCQEVVHTDIKEVNGAAKANLDIQKDFVNVLSYEKKIFRDECSKVLENFVGSNIEERKKRFERLQKAVTNFIKKIHQFTVVDVAGGIITYINVFFSENSIHTLRKEKNDQYIDLLKIFRTVEKLIQLMQDCLAEIENLNVECSKLIPKFTQEEFKALDDKTKEFIQTAKNFIVENEENVETYNQNIDEIVDLVDRVRNRSDMDNKMATIRDELDTDDEEEWI